MRLLNTKTLQFSEFYDITPEYAILSHRWTGDEVSYADFIAGPETDTPRYSKIVEACSMAAGDYDLDWIWIDTCCINKDSSAELSEAINSMYRWYEKAALCLAYLNDVPSKPVESTGLEHEAFLVSLRNSKWFTRGWTLQELLAPRKVVFVSSQWQPIGEKSEYARLISDITNIDIDVFIYTFRPDRWSVAAKMSWASGRLTSRVEDEAYCLLGLFQINMPLLYGEGRRAFTRLQEEIVRNIDDETVFVWFINSHSFLEDISGNLFAARVSHFAGCGNISKMLYDERQPYSLTNRGLHVDVVLLPLNDGTYLIPLNCNIRTCDGSEVQLALEVTRSEEQRSVYSRRRCVDVKSAGYEMVIGLMMPTQTRTTVLLHQVYTSDNSIQDFLKQFGKHEPTHDLGIIQVYERFNIADGDTEGWSRIEPEDLLDLFKASQTVAEEKGLQALRAYEKEFGVDSESTLNMVYTLGLLCSGGGKWAEADEFYIRALQGYKKIGGRHGQMERIITRKLQPSYRKFVWNLRASERRRMRLRQYIFG